MRRLQLVTAGHGLAFRRDHMTEYKSTRLGFELKVELKPGVVLDGTKFHCVQFNSSSMSEMTMLFLYFVPTTLNMEPTAVYVPTSMKLLD